MAVRLAGEIVVLLWPRDSPLRNHVHPRRCVARRRHPRADRPETIADYSDYRRWFIARVYDRKSRSSKPSPKSSKSFPFPSARNYGPQQVTSMKGNERESRRPRKSMQSLPMSSNKPHGGERFPSGLFATGERELTTNAPSRGYSTASSIGLKFYPAIWNSSWNRYGQRAEFRSRVESFPFSFAAYDNWHKRDVLMQHRFRRLNFTIE